MRMGFSGATDNFEIDELLAPLHATERGFVLGLLLSRGQEQREDTARVLSGAQGLRCAAVVRGANALSRDGRLQLIRQLASEVLGSGSNLVDAFTFPDHRLATTLALESDEILGLLAQEPSATLALAATNELSKRGRLPEPRDDRQLGVPGAAPSGRNEDLVELRRALLSQLTRDDDRSSTRES